MVANNVAVLSLILVALSGLLLQCSLAARKRYDGYKVLSVVPTDDSQVQLLHDFMMNDSEVDFWQEPSHVGHEIKFAVSPNHWDAVVCMLNDARISYTIDIDDVQQKVLNPVWRNITNQARNRNRHSVAFDLNNFHRVEKIYTWMYSLASRCRTGLKCKVYNIGLTHQGRPIYVFLIRKKVPNRKAYWIDSTIHAREWITTATIIKVMDRMARGSTAEAVQLTDAYDWYFLPVLNPDGYSYSWHKDRMWRKNRRQVSNNCYGVDLNRNFNISWGTDGVSHNPCSDIYCGPTGGSEPETQAVSRELVRLGSILIATVTMHSYGRMWMFPFGHTVASQQYSGRRTCHRALDHDDLMRVALATAEAIGNTHGTSWEHGNSCEVIYPAAGGTDDYAKGVAGVKYAFCPELRGNSFVVDPGEIQPSFEEFWNGVVAMCAAINA